MIRTMTFASLTLIACGLLAAGRPAQAGVAINGIAIHHFLDRCEMPQTQAEQQTAGYVFTAQTVIPASSPSATVN